MFAIAMVHCDNPIASAITVGLFATGVAASVLIIAAHDQPFADGHYLVDSLPGAENDFRITDAQFPMMIEARILGGIGAVSHVLEAAGRSIAFQGGPSMPRVTLASLPEVDEGS